MKIFAQKPWPEKRKSLGLRWLRFVPAVPLPIRLPWGSVWLVRNDACGTAILLGDFEQPEREFVERLLQPGMTVLDIGAHHGFYTLLAACRVGSNGRVLAFEPSPRERKSLKRHIRLNRCTNVIVEALALGSTAGTANLFIAEGRETGCNSLRKPNISDTTREVPVRVRRLDHILEKHAIWQVDFIKLDAEGGELEILRGAGKFFDRQPRPVILAEVQDIRTRPWGYDAREIIAFLNERGFSWFKLLQGGNLESVKVGRREYDGNFVAIPPERIAEVLKWFHASDDRIVAAV
ncbi:MAG: FkbM family methyltransferase [Candidatus Acidiferrales bacterium]